MKPYTHSKQGIRLGKEEAKALGRLASKICRERGIEKEYQEDESYHKVGCYPESILHEAHSNLFGK